MVSLRSRPVRRPSASRVRTLRDSLSTLLLVACTSASASQSEVAVPNDNTRPAGRLAKGVLTLQLEARGVMWFPEGPKAPGIRTVAFAEVGKRPTVPAPLIRVPSGTELRVTVRNTLAVPIDVRGLQERRGAALDSTIIPPGASHLFQFRVERPGTYSYWGRSEPQTHERPGFRADGPLAGAFIIDPAGVLPDKRERILVINTWVGPVPALGAKSEERHLVLQREMIQRDHWLVSTINGLSWPHTPRLSYSVGDSVRWRVVNASGAPHPMHLHGFYFSVLSRGSSVLDTIHDPAHAPLAVTETLEAGGGMRLLWIPERAGNWLFHCHFANHISEAMRLRKSDGEAHGSHANHAEEGMGGLVMGIHVSSGRRRVAHDDATARRRLRLFITERPGVYGTYPGYGYVVQETETPPAPDSIRAPGSTIHLRQDEPAEIAVINLTREATSVHWHGIELESFFDGVAGWSGAGKRLAPMIAPRDSFVVRLTPPRAGTFIYHTHASEGIKLSSGMYGALIVTPPHADRDTTDRIVLLSLDGPRGDARMLINGSTSAPPFEIRAGVAHRFRLISITPMERGTVELLANGKPQDWRALAKDGAELPGPLATMRRASLRMNPGETHDFEIRRERPDTSLVLRVQFGGTTDARLEARRAGSPAPRVVVDIPIIVR